MRAIKFINFFYIFARGPKIGLAARARPGGGSFQSQLELEQNGAEEDWLRFGRFLGRRRRRGSLFSPKLSNLRFHFQAELLLFCGFAAAAQAKSIHKVRRHLRFVAAAAAARTN